MKPERLLLRRIAALSIGEKLPLSRFGRELNCSAAVVMCMVERLVEGGALDRLTLRPPLPSAPPPHEPRQLTPETAAVAEAEPRVSGGEFPAISAEDLLAEIDAYSARTGTPLGFIGKVAFNRPGFVPLLRKRRSLRPQSAQVILDVLAQFPEGISKDQAIAPASRRAQSGRIEAIRAVRFDPQADGSSTRVEESATPVIALPKSPTGNDLVDAVEQAARDRGVPLHDFIQPLVKDVGKLAQMRIARRPYAATIARVKALLSGDPVPPKMRAANAPVPQQFVRRVDREQSGLPPSQRELRENCALDQSTRSRAKIERLRELNESRHAEHDRNLHEVVLREAEARAGRRHQAGRLTTAHPLNVSDVLGDAALDGIDTAADRRARELEELANPSSVLRRAQRDWPAQCVRVKALAAELEITLAEAWRRVIGAGIECLTDPEAA